MDSMSISITVNYQNTKTDLIGQNFVSDQSKTEFEMSWGTKKIVMSSTSLETCSAIKFRRRKKSKQFIN